MSARNFIPRQSILSGFPPKDDLWAQQFWPQWTWVGQAQLENYRWQQKYANELARHNMWLRAQQEQATANAQQQATILQQEIAIRRWAEENRQKEKERRELFGEELYALMKETDRLEEALSSMSPM